MDGLELRGVIPASRAEIFTRLSRNIAQEVDGFRPGQQLGARNEVAAVLGTSRPTLTDTLVEAEIQGLVECGINGDFIAWTAAARMRLGPRPWENPSRKRLSVEQMLMIRRDLEGAAAARAAVAARTSEKLRRDLKAAFEIFRTGLTAESSDVVLRKDLRFHWLVFGACPAENSPGGVYDEAQDYALEVLAEKLASCWDDSRFREEVLGHNQQLFESIVRCDPAEAKGAARRYAECLARKVHGTKRTD